MIEQEIETRIAKLEARNMRVELDKAWETSWTRKILIAVLTYFVVVLYLAVVVRIDPWVNAIVPVVGFLLSTLTVGYAKSVWVNRHFITKKKL